MPSRYWVGGGSSNHWSATGNTNWSATSGGANNASVPAATDDVFLDFASGLAILQPTITNASICKTLTCTGFTGTLTHNAAIVLAISGDLIFSAAMAYTPGAGAIIRFNNTIGNIANITTNGKIIDTLRLVGGGTYTLQDNLIVSSSSGGDIELNVGIFNANNHNITSDNYLINASSAGITINMGSGVWTVQNDGLIDFENSTGLVVNVNTSTINIVSGTLIDNGIALYNLTLNTLGNSINATNILFDSVTVTNNFNIVGPNTNRFTQGTTLTLNGAVSISGGSAAHKIVWQSDILGMPAFVVKASGAVTGTWLDLFDSQASGGAVFTANSSIDEGGNSGWNIIAPVNGGQGQLTLTGVGS